MFQTVQLHTKLVPDVSVGVSFEPVHAKVPDVGNTVIVPFAVNGQIFGALGMVGNGDSDENFKPEEIELIQSVGHAIALAMGNAQRCRELL